MMYSPQTFVEKGLNLIFIGSLVLFFITLSWNTGWHMLGEAYALGPYLPWLELVFPLAGLGMWGAFFSQWALGRLQPIHLSRWFYLLFFMGMLMIGVLFSVKPDSSLGYLSLWLTASLMLSLDLKATMEKAWFWWLYASSIGFGFMLSFYFPEFVNDRLLVLMLWFGTVHHFFEKKEDLITLGYVGIMLLVLWISPSLGSLGWLVYLSFIFLWWGRYGYYRRKNIWLWTGVLLALIIWGWGYLNLPDSFWVQNLSPDFLAIHHWWHGVGLGQFEWAQFKASESFFPPEEVVTSISFWQRLWYEYGVLAVLLILSLGLLTLGRKKHSKFILSLFIGTVLLAPDLWSTPGGIMLAAFWFFNRQTWVVANQSPAPRNPVGVKSASNHPV